MSASFSAVPVVVSLACAALLLFIVAPAAAHGTPAKKAEEALRPPQILDPLDQDFWKTGIAVLALLVSLGSVIVSRIALIKSQQPVVVFEYAEGDIWEVHNVGRGPALNVTVDVRGRAGRWAEPVIVPALPSNGVFRLRWLGSLNAWMLGATYSDLDGRPYTTVSQHDGNIVKRKHCLQRFLAVDKDYLSGRNARRYWKAPDLITRTDLE